jgi:hypothetical protein
LDRARRAAQPAPSAAPKPPEPQASGAAAAAAAAIPEPTPAGGSIPWREKLPGVLMELGLSFTADAVEHSEIVESNGELQFTTPKDLSLGMNPEDINKAVRQIAGRPYRIKVTIGETGITAAPVAGKKKQADEVTSRALSDPEVQRFRELFGGEVRDVRNLKE